MIHWLDHRRTSTLFAAALCVAAAPAAFAQVEVELGGGGGGVLDRVDPVLRAVVELRELAPKHAIPAGTHSRETLREVLLEQLAEEVTPEEIATEVSILAQLGVLDPSRDYYALLVDLLTSQIAGFYDEETQELFLLDDLPASAEEPTLAHELFHGIQDQLFGILTVRPEWERADDAMLAGTALIEGDAVGVMIDYSLGGALSFTDIPNFLGLVEDQLDRVGLAPLEDVPGFIQRDLLFPYIDGLAFVHFIKSAGGWAAVDAVYLDPPLSTEQILHPERYLDRDVPTWIELDLSAIQALGYELIYENVIGEFQWHSLLTEVLSDSLAQRAVANAVAGWDGDRLVALRDEDGSQVLVALSVWDSSRDAREFAAVLRRLIEVRDDAEMDEHAAGPYGSAAVVEVGDRITWIEHWGDMVLLLDGVPEDQVGLDPIEWLEVIWRGRSRGHYVPPTPVESGADEAEDDGARPKSALEAK